jgi:alpha-L-fucosidase
MKNSILLIVICLLLFLLADGQSPFPFVPKPSERQIQWSNMEFYLFVHFGPNTFTDLEWGKGSEHEEVFNPSSLDCRQWCRIAKAAGAKGIIITAKHHDGFCLWPSRYSMHTVAQSSWKNGKGDVLRELRDACDESGLKMGVYLSPWDRNHPAYGTAGYNEVFINMMKEIVENYGPLFEFWWDGANGEGPNGKKQVYDFAKFEKTLRAIAPNTVIFSDIGPDLRWVGNEKGIAGKTNWNLLDTVGFSRGAGAPPIDTLNAGNENGKNWIPAECDVSIRPGWFYHKQEDSLVKNPEELFKLYLQSVGRGASLLLNVPPDQRGLINEHDSIALIGFKKLRDESFAVNLAKNGKAFFMTNNGNRPAPDLNDGQESTCEFIPLIHQNSVGIAFDHPVNLNCIVLKEFLKEGQTCKKFRILLMNEKHEILKEVIGTTIGHKRIITFPSLRTSSISLSIDQQKAQTGISELEAYRIEDRLVEQH